jgi:hypothetical protein
MLTFGGNQYDIAHLAPLKRRVKVPLKGGFAKTVLLEFHFSNHCYSRRPTAEEVIPPDMLVMDATNRRVFSPLRYELSRLVMSCIDDLLTDGGDVHWSRHKNFFQVDDVEIDNKPKVSFYIFMSARKEVPHNGQKYIRIQVESAYTADPNLPTPQSARAEKFLEVLGRYWANAI